MPKIKSPCLDCSRRTVGCHGSCEDYKAYSLKNQEQNELKRADNIKRTEAICFEQDAKFRTLKRWRKN
jgi:hypothetical protein